jgi:hypothetical protein
MADSSFSSWLALREEADAMARSVQLEKAIVDRLLQFELLRVVDLAAGTGANLRYLAPRLGIAVQDWLLVDHDRDLLKQVPSRMPDWGSRPNLAVETREIDLDSLDHHEIFAGRQLVTASALLDLVSERWLIELAARCRAIGAVALFALTYNGRSRCLPAEPEDDLVRELVNRHQRRAKGLGGPAVGPDGVDAAERVFTQAGFHTQRAASDWMLPPRLSALQRRLIEGWAEPAIDVAPERAAVIRDWLRRRIAHVDAGHSEIVVGHEDVAAWQEGVGSIAIRRVP